MSRVDELKQRLAAIREAPKIRKHQFTGTPFVKSNDDLTKMKTTHFLELAADKLGKPNTGSITGLADAHSNPSYDSKYFKGLERGDELGVVEQKKQNIRHKGKSGVPMLINWKGKNQITGHEGRHLGRALLEEGFDEIPVEFTEGFMNTDPAKKYKNTKNLIRQNKNKMPNLKDTRAPIFGRYSKVKQRLAYIGKTKYDKQLTNIQKEFEGMRPDILKRRHGTDMGKYDLPSHNEFGHLCTDEATCGATSSALFKKLGLDEGKSNVGFKNVKIEGGVYSGPGSEYSGAAVDTTDYKKRKRGESLSSIVGHEWIKLEDGTIVDGSSGQFMNQDAGIEDGKYKGKEHRQNQRLRIIRQNDPLYKHYKGKYELDKFTNKKKWYDPKDPLKKHVDKLERRMKSSKLKQRLSRLQQ